MYLFKQLYVLTSVDTALSVLVQIVALVQMDGLVVIVVKVCLINVTLYNVVYSLGWPITLYSLGWPITLYNVV